MKNPSITIYLIKPVPVQTIHLAEIGLPGQVSVEKWQKEYIQVTATILSKNASTETLKKLSKIGRYDFSIISFSDTINICMPKINDFITIQGKVLTEDFEFNVVLPDNYKYVILKQ